MSDEAERSEDHDKSITQLRGSDPSGGADYLHEDQTKVKKKKKKKKPPTDDDVQAYAEALAEGAAADVGEGEVKHEEEAVEEDGPPGKDVEDDGRIIGLTIHRTDKLKTDFYIAHPLVRVHMVDVDTGYYLKKQRK